MVTTSERCRSCNPLDESRVSRPGEESNGTQALPQLWFRSNWNIGLSLRPIAGSPAHPVAAGRRGFTRANRITCQAAAEAFRILGAHRVAVINPPWFTEEVNSKGMGYFRTPGFEVVLCARITPARPFTEVPPAEVYEWTRANVPRGAEVVFIAGNGLRAVGAIRALEEGLRRPVLTANQVAFWKALQLVGMTSKMTQYGRVFTTSGPTR